MLQRHSLLFFFVGDVSSCNEKHHESTKFPSKAFRTSDFANFLTLEPGQPRVLFIYREHRDLWHWPPSPKGCPFWTWWSCLVVVQSREQSSHHSQALSPRTVSTFNLDSKFDFFLCPVLLGYLKFLGQTIEEKSA